MIENQCRCQGRHRKFTRPDHKDASIKTSTRTSVKKNVKIKNKKIKLRSTNKFFIFQYNDRESRKTKCHQ